MQKEIAYNESNYDEVESFELILGYIPGYDQEQLENEHQYDDMEKFSELYYQIAEKIYREDDVFVTSIIDKSRAIYPGCYQGERVYCIKGTRNPKYCEDKQKYKKAVLKLARVISSQLDQSTFSITWNYNISYDYFTKDDE